MRDNLVVAKTRWLRHNENLLTLDFLLRFHVILDFPNNLVYFEPSRRLNVRDSEDRSGLHFLRKNNQPTIDLVDKGSPAEAAGIKTGDVLLAVNGSEIARSSYYQLRMKLGVPAGPVPVRVKRGDQELNFELQWEDVPPMPPAIVKKKFLDDD